jgi:hypothetical protein
VVAEHAPIQHTLTVDDIYLMISPLQHVVAEHAPIQHTLTVNDIYYVLLPRAVREKSLNTFFYISSTVSVCCIGACSATTCCKGEIIKYISLTVSVCCTLQHVVVEHAPIQHTLTVSDIYLMISPLYMFYYHVL